jgi:hypothetical protein
VIVVCCQVEFSESNGQLIQESLTDFGVSEGDREGSTKWMLWPSWGWCAIR